MHEGLDAKEIVSGFSALSVVSAAQFSRRRTIPEGYPLEIAAAQLRTHASEVSRLRRGDLSRFCLTRIIRFVARTGHDIDVHLKKTPRLEERARPRCHPASSVVRYDYYGRQIPIPPAR